MTIFDNLPDLPNENPAPSNLDDWTHPMEASVTELPNRPRVDIPDVPDVNSMPIPGVIGAVCTSICGGAMLSLIPGTAALFSPTPFGAIALAALVAGRLKGDPRIAPLSLVVIIGMTVGSALVTVRTDTEIVVPESAPVQFSNPMVEGQ
jgi:hypothetical protein